MGQTLDALREGETPERRPPAVERFFRTGPVALDSEKRPIVIGDTPSSSAELTENEISILAFLMKRPDQVISSRELARSAGSYDVTENEARNTVRPHFSRLRRKLEAKPREPRLIRTVRGRGYLFASLLWSVPRIYPTNQKTIKLQPHALIPRVILFLGDDSRESQLVIVTGQAAETGLRRRA